MDREREKSKRFQDRWIIGTDNGVGHPRLPDRFFSAQARFQRTPWLFAAADDLRFPTTLGNRSASVWLFNWYRLQLATFSNKRVGTRLSEVTQFVRPMSSLFAPQIVSRVVVATIRRQIKQGGRQVTSDGIRLMPPGAQ
jgi:hypothetical protein